MNHRVVVTGWGVISSIGHNAAEFWSSLSQGVSGIRAVTTVPPGEPLPSIIADVKNYDAGKFLDPRILPALDRCSQFAVIAAREAIGQSGLTFDGKLSERTATIIGTGVGGQNTEDEQYRRLYREGNKRVHPLTVPKLMVNAPASQISMQCGLRGPTFVIASACASATHAIGTAFQMVRSGAAEVAVTGGTEACITYATLKAWEALRILAPDTCRPFSRNRKGLVLGEGAAAMVLETLENAKRRGANILGEIAGFGMSADAADLLAPDAGGMTRAIEGAMADAKLNVTDVRHINAHGTGTAANDLTETAAVKRAFGAHASNLVLTANKSMMGHALGAAGALELVSTLMTLKYGVVPPTINYLGPDPDCDLDYVPNEPREMQFDTALSNSFAFGGLNAVLAVRRFS